MSMRVLKAFLAIHIYGSKKTTKHTNILEGRRIYFSLFLDFKFYEVATVSRGLTMHAYNQPNDL